MTEVLNDPHLNCHAKLSPSTTPVFVFCINFKLRGIIYTIMCGFASKPFVTSNFNKFRLHFNVLLTDATLQTTISLTVSRYCRKWWPRRKVSCSLIKIYFKIFVKMDASKAYMYASWPGSRKKNICILHHVFSNND